MRSPPCADRARELGVVPVHRGRIDEVACFENGPEDERSSRLGGQVDGEIAGGVGGFGVVARDEDARDRRRYDANRVIRTMETIVGWPVARRTLAAVLPKNARFSPRMPAVPITMPSACSRRAHATIVGPGRPSIKSVEDRTFAARARLVASSSTVRASVSSTATRS